MAKIEVWVCDFVPLGGKDRKVKVFDSEDAARAWARAKAEEGIRINKVWELT